VVTTCCNMDRLTSLMHQGFIAFHDSDYSILTFFIFLFPWTWIWPYTEDGSLYEDDTHSRKRRRTTVDGIDEGYEMAGDLLPLSFSEPSFDDLCGDAAFSKEESECYDNKVGSWGLLDGHILARIFHFLRADVKSLVFAALTCKHWRAAVGFYKNLSIRVDLSTMGSNCTDNVVGSILVGFRHISFVLCV